MRIDQIARLDSVRAQEPNQGILLLYMDVFEKVYANEEAGLNVREMREVLCTHVNELFAKINATGPEPRVLQMYCELISSYLIAYRDDALAELHGTLDSMLEEILQSHPLSGAYYDIWEKAIAHCTGRQIVDDYHILTRLAVFELLSEQNAPLPTFETVLLLLEKFVSRTAITRKE